MIYLEDETYFLDMDGTLVKHNYTPLEVQDEYLPGTIEFLTKLKKANCYCVLTTGRSEEECKYILNKFKEDIGFIFDKALYLLPVGVRVLVNDNKYPYQNKAVAICLERDAGPKSIL